MAPFKRLLLVATVIAASSIPVALANAVTATFTGGPSMSATATTSTLLKLVTTGKTLSCTSGTANGSVVASASGLLPLTVGTLTPAFSGCNIVGGLGITVNCQKSVFRTTGSTMAPADATSVAITTVSCHVFVTSQTACRVTISGSTGAHYTNAPGRLLIDGNHQSISANNSTNGAGATCSVLPNDASARFRNASNGDLHYLVNPSNLALNVS